MQLFTSMELFTNSEFSGALWLRKTWFELTALEIGKRRKQKNIKLYIGMLRKMKETNGYGALGKIKNIYENPRVPWELINIRTLSESVNKRNEFLEKKNRK